MKSLFRLIAAALPLVLIIVMSCKQDGDNPVNTNSDPNGTIVRIDSISPGDFKTWGQGAWGAPPHGHNPGAYLRDNWDLLDTVIVGCDSGYTLTFTSSLAISQFLPQGSKPAPLDSSYVNPNFRFSNLAGQVLALALNIGFDLADSSFGLSNNHLEDLCVAYGTFEGWTVAEVFDEANKILGGCTSTYTPSEINEAVGKINENFDDNYVGDYLEYCTVPKSRH